MMKSLFGAIAVAAAIATQAHSETVTIATWNIEHLRADNGVGSVKREDADYSALARYADDLDADIIALQEVDGAEAAARVFDPMEYDFFFSDRNNVQRTGFAIRKSIEILDETDFIELALDGSVRRGTDVTVQIGDQPIRLSRFT